MFLWWCCFLFCVVFFVFVTPCHCTWGLPLNYPSSMNKVEWIHLVRHESGEGASNLMIVHVGLGGTKQDENKADRDGDLQDGLQNDCLIQPDKGHGRLLQKLHAAWKKKTVNQKFSWLRFSTSLYKGWLGLLVHPSPVYSEISQQKLIWKMNPPTHCHLL